jgi:hypothetical protein
VQNRTPISASSTTPQQKPSFPQGSFSLQFPQNNQVPYDMSSFDNWNNLFTTALPAETQGLLGSTMNMNDPLSQMMMQGSTALPGNFYDFSNQSLPPQTSSIGKHQSYPSLDGLSSTLAPPSQDTLQRPQDYSNTQDFFNEALNAGSNGVTPSGTPGLNDWQSYINTDAWDVPSSSQTSQ